jgi:hypothetical protein
MEKECASCEVRSGLLQVASISQLTVSRLSIQCGILNTSQPYRPPWPVTGIALLYLLFNTVYKTLSVYRFINDIKVTLNAQCWWPQAHFILKMLVSKSWNTRGAEETLSEVKHLTHLYLLSVFNNLKSQIYRREALCVLYGDSLPIICWI